MAMSHLRSWVLGLLYLVMNATNSEIIDIYSQQHTNKTINCESNEDCLINCNTEDSCAYSTIQCPINYECKIFCGYQSNACLNLNINAIYSSLFELNGCSSNSSNSSYDLDLNICSGLTIYFPPKDINGNKRSFINGGDNLNGRLQRLQFYAINGWDDINTLGYMGTYAYFYGIMHCTVDYTEQCNFNQQQFLCESANNLCNNPYFNYTLNTDLYPANSIDFIENVSQGSRKQGDILWYIVVILSIFICGFSLILIYHINRAVRLQKKINIARIHNHYNNNINENSIHTHTNTDNNQNRISLTVKSTESKSHNIGSTNNTNSNNHNHNINKEIKPLTLDTDKSDKVYKSMKSVKAQIPQNPIQVIIDDFNTFPIVNATSISSVPSVPSLSSNIDMIDNGNDIDIIANIINYSIKQERMNDINDINDMNMNDLTELDVISNIFNENNQSYADSVLSDEMNLKTKEHKNVPSLMFLYNSDMAIPEGIENINDIIHHDNNHNDIIVISSPTPTLPKSPTLTLSDDETEHSNGLLQSVIPWPNTPKLPPSSNISEESSLTTVSNMTYMTASSIVNSLLSSNQSSRSYRTESTEQNINNNSFSMETPICSNHEQQYEQQYNDAYEYDNEYEYDSDEDDDDYSSNNNNNNNHKHKKGNTSDTLMISEDNDDTSSWISAEEYTNSHENDGNNDNQHVHLKVSINSDDTFHTNSNSNTEYDSSTSSMCTEMQEYFTKEVTEDEEESIDFGQ